MENGGVLICKHGQKGRWGKGAGLLQLGPL